MPTERTFLIDSHAHLDSGQFGHDLDDVLSRARENDVDYILTIGCDMASSDKSVALAERYEQVYAAVGVHPHDAGEIDADSLRRLEQSLSHPKVVALGEIGLDYYRDRSPRDIQRHAFREQIRLALKMNKPIIVHDRDAHEEVMQILVEEKAAQVGGVLHCFSGGPEMAKECLELGFYLSFPGPLTYPKNDRLRDIVGQIPLNRILVETDCPYLAPQPFRGKRNEPAYVRYTAEKLAEIKGLSLEDVARVTSRNCGDLFGIGPDTGTAQIVYSIRDSLYLNITNRCTNSCVFCAKSSDYTVKGHYLKLDREPTFNAVTQAVGDPSRYREVVFCGYGEPLLRLELVKQLAAWLKQRRATVRINTDGLANLVHGRNILPELCGLVDAVSVSLNAANAEEYARLCPSDYGRQSYPAVKSFISRAKELLPQVTATAVTFPGVDIEACARVAAELGVEFRARTYQPLAHRGSHDAI